jgi:hypothetical protein
MTSLADPVRCHGCGTETTAPTVHESDDGVTVIARYCPGCEALRQLRGITPGNHPQGNLRGVDA